MFGQGHLALQAGDGGLRRGHLGFGLGHVELGHDAVPAIELDLGQIQRIAARGQRFLRDLQLAIERAQVEVGGGHAGHQPDLARVPVSFLGGQGLGQGGSSPRGAPGPTHLAHRRAGRTGCTGPSPAPGAGGTLPARAVVNCRIDRGEEGGALDAIGRQSLIHPGRRDLESLLWSSAT